jgi:anti-sigma factor RsiW
MKSKHITEILDRKGFSGLNNSELTLVSSHTTECPECKRALQAAQISAVLLKVRAESEAFTPSPFFQAKVMNAWRERTEKMRQPIFAFRRWWQASYGLVFSMCLIVFTLVGLTIFAPLPNANDVQAEMSNYSLYSTENIILNQKTSRDLTPEQTLEVIYNERTDLKRK